MKILVTAGGQGTKLWPYSREDKPKQFQPIVGDVSSYTENIQTLLKKFAPEDIYISSKRRFIKYISEQSPQIPLKNYIIEPDIAKDRGPGEGLAFLRLSVLHPDEPVFLVQADDIRLPEDAFLKMVEDAGKIVAKEKSFVTGGIKATEPNMGIDYLKLGERLHQDTGQEVYAVGEFITRLKSYKETKELIENFRVVAHCNHLCWYPGMLLDAYKKHRPDWYDALMRMKACFDKPGEDAAIEEIYASMEKGPTEDVTKHVMNSPESRVILLPFKWIDIGTWGSVYDYLEGGDGTTNYADGKGVFVDTRGTFVKTSNDKKVVAVAGVDDLIIVDTDDVLLVIPKYKIEQIKDIQKLLKDQGDTEYL
ncbi:MAG TPA: sugar phosphate nucleotidyltransferase [Candidatus Saccharimonadales bacterium]|nr:sugar phosphate nucleotidyltransferase [Candidatus Saccharimonadales bacterium]